MARAGEFFIIRSVRPRWVGIFRGLRSTEDYAEGVKKKTTGFSTAATHAGHEGLIEQGVHAVPIDLSTTAPLADVQTGGASYEKIAGGGSWESGDSTVYRRLWSPTAARLETAVAALESIDDEVDSDSTEAVAFATGMAAISAVFLSRVRKGTPHVVAVRPLYGGTDHILNTGLLGNQVSYVGVDEVAGAIRPNTGLVMIESPANPTLELIDIRHVANQAAGVPVMVDNTFATPYLQRPLAHGARFSVHSATKYLGGHGDAMGGIVVTTTEEATLLRSIRAVTGAILDPFSAYLLLRGLPTLAIRMDAQQSNAQALANWLSGRTEISRVMYPGLPGADPQGILGRQALGAGAMVSIDMAGGFGAASRLCERLELVTHAVSLGSVDTLIQHPAALTHRPVEASAKPGDGVLRISVGLEDIDDIVADFSQALAG
jgi:methionine-gamma-lyase